MKSNEDFFDTPGALVLGSTLNFDKSPDGSFLGILQLVNVCNEYEIAYMLKSPDPDLFSISSSKYEVLERGSSNITQILISTCPKIKHSFGDIKTNIFLLCLIPIQITNKEFDLKKVSKKKLRLELKDFWRKDENLQKSELIFIRADGKYAEYYNEAPKYYQISKDLERSIFVQFTPTGFLSDIYLILEYMNMSNGRFGDPTSSIHQTEVEFVKIMSHPSLNYLPNKMKLKVLKNRKTLTELKNKHIELLREIKRKGIMWSIFLVLILGCVLILEFFGETHSEQTQMDHSYEIV